MSISNQQLLKYFEGILPWALGILEEWVRLESPTSDIAAVNALGNRIAECFEAQGLAIKRIPHQDSGDHLMGCWNGPLIARDGAPVLFLGHIDTVWQIGQLQQMPIKRLGDRLYGPGVCDMKAGVLLMLLCTRAFRELSLASRQPVRILLSSDEERGSEGSRKLIEEAALGCRYVLCLEPPLPGNLAKTARKGVYRFNVEVFGVSAHAGVDHEKGVNALEEMAHQVLLLQAMTDYLSGTTVSVGTISTRNAPNVVPDYAIAEVDVRAMTLEAGQAISQRILGLRPYLSGTRLKISGGLGRPPLERTPEIVRMYSYAAGVAQELGFKLGEGLTGGGSDGSLTAAMGIPTLDGMGVDGDGSHSLDEHILVSDIPRKAALLARLIETYQPA
jgi:glutamate carboxypeptidase